MFGSIFLYFLQHLHKRFFLTNCAFFFFTVKLMLFIFSQQCKNKMVDGKVYLCIACEIHIRFKERLNPIVLKRVWIAYGHFSIFHIITLFINARVEI